MVKGNPRFQPLVVWPAKAAGMSELQPDDQIVRPAKSLLVSRNTLVPQRRQSRFVVRRCQRLIRIRPSIGLHGGRLAAPDQFRPASAEIPPAAERQFAWRSIAIRIPSLHRMN